MPGIMAKMNWKVLFSIIVFANLELDLLRYKIVFFEFDNELFIDNCFFLFKLLIKLLL